MATRFIVDLGSVTLDARASARINDSIQKAALAALSDMDFGRDYVVRFPKEWLGIWIDIYDRVPNRDGIAQIDEKLHLEFSRG